MTVDRVNQLLLSNAMMLEKQNGNLSKNQCRHILIVLRMNVRNVISAVLDSRAEITRLTRYEKELKRQGITMLPVLQAKEEAREWHKNAQTALAENGRLVMKYLDLWQEKGATLLDLCYLCGHEHRRTLREIRAENRGMKFSKLVFVYNLDFRNDKANFLEFETDAPLTHAVKEHMLDLMLNTKAGMQASRQAFIKCFPEIWDDRLILTKDCEGDDVFVDKDGEIVGYLERSE